MKLSLISYALISCILLAACGGTVEPVPTDAVPEMPVVRALPPMDAGSACPVLADVGKACSYPPGKRVCIPGGFMLCDAAVGWVFMPDDAGACEVCK